MYAGWEQLEMGGVGGNGESEMETRMNEREIICQWKY